MSRLIKPIINFTQISNEILTDPKTSLKAKGLYAYLISKPDDYDFSSERIATECKEDRKAIMRALTELETAGYLTRIKNPSGRVDYQLFNSPSEKPYLIPKSQNGTLAQPPEKPYLIPKSQRRTLGPISNTTSTTKKTESNNLKNLQDWKPSELHQQIIRSSCRNIPVDQYDIEIEKFKLHYQDNPPTSPDKLWLSWCQWANTSYYQQELKQKRIDEADKLAQDRMHEFDQKKKSNIANIGSGSAQENYFKSKQSEHHKQKDMIEKEMCNPLDFASMEEFNQYVVNKESQNVRVVYTSRDYDDACLIWKVSPSSTLEKLTIAYDQQN